MEGGNLELQEMLLIHIQVRHCLNACQSCNISKHKKEIDRSILANNVTKSSF